MSSGEKKQIIRRFTVPAFKARKRKEPIVMLTAYTARMAELLDPHCDALLVGDSLAQAIYGLPSTVPVTLDMMIAHGQAVMRGAQKSMVIIDMPFGSYEVSPEQAFCSASRILKETGATAVKLEAPTVAFLTNRGIPVMGHIGLTPQAVNTLGGYGARGKDAAEYTRILMDAKAIENAGAFSILIEGVLASLATEITNSVECPTIGIGGSNQCDGQVLVVDDMLGMFEKTAKFVKKFDQLSERIDAAASLYASTVKSREFPGPQNIYGA
jgi:3-methyl-2-oxobutanoate hydroxymethyltransferase